MSEELVAFFARATGKALLPWQRELIIALAKKQGAESHIFFRRDGSRRTRAGAAVMAVYELEVAGGAKYQQIAEDWKAGKVSKRAIFRAHREFERDRSEEMRERMYGDSAPWRKGEDKS